MTITIIVHLLWVEDVTGDTTRTLGEPREKFRVRRLVGALRECARGPQDAEPKSDGGAG